MSELKARIIEDMKTAMKAKNKGALKAGFRTGDKAPMAIVQLVDFDSTASAEATSTDS